VDVHSHAYLSSYMDLLRARTSVPRVVQGPAGEDRLVILPGEDVEATTAAGRPIGPEYFDVGEKLRFMDRHGIATTLLSLANPWLDFMEPEEAAVAAKVLNDEMHDVCEASGGRLLGLATLPTQAPAAAAAELRRMRAAGYSRTIKGVILGTSGAGKGMDDPALDEVYAELEEQGMLVFIHPHHGVGTEHFHGAGHALFLALGFPFETTTAAARLIVSGTLDRFPGLKLLLAHSGGTLPWLIGRLDSCVMHDLAIAQRLEHAPSEYLKRMFFDSINYRTENLTALIEMLGPGGEDRILFGTDNPFFPPPGESALADTPWPSTVRIIDTVGELADATRDKILFGNAQRLFSA